MSDGANSDNTKHMSLSRWVFAIGGLIVGAFLVSVLVMIGRHEIGTELKLPLVVILGVVVLLIVIGLLTFGFSKLDLANRDQALGLPDGSVRAILALMLIVLFSILAIFLYNSVASGVQLIADVSKTELAGVRKQVPVLIVVPNPEENTTGPYKVYYRNSTPAGDDIAKTLITLLGTLVTAVAAFYFGANSVASAHEAMKPKGNDGQGGSPGGDGGSGGGAGATIRSVTPDNLKIGSQNQDLKISGANLTKAKSVTLVRDGAPTITTTWGSASNAEVACTVSIKADAVVGKYDVVISDGKNDFAKKPQAFEVTQS